MKHIFYNIAAALIAIVAMAACSPEDFNGADGNIPEASNYQAKVDVNQDENTATFTLVDKNGDEASGVYPIWEINTGSLVKSTVSGYTTGKIVLAGEYSYTLKVGNRNGVSDGTISGTFTINTTRFDFSDYVAKLTGDGTKEWRVYAAKAEHMGCGESLASPTGWWKANPHDKDAEGIYDDRITFTKGNSLSSGDYKYSAGADGLTFLNNGVTKFGASPGSDWSTAAVGKAGAKSDATYTLGYDAANEMVTITLPANTLFPYIASDKQFDGATTFYLKDLNDKTMTLAWDAGGIWWQLILVNGEDEKTEEQIPVNWCDVNSDLNLGKAFNAEGVGLDQYFAPGWNASQNYVFEYKDGVYNITAGDATYEQWQAQFKLVGVPVKLVAGEFYDISVEVEANNAFDKFTWKIAKDGNDNQFLESDTYMQSVIKLKKGKNVITFSKVKTKDSENADQDPTFDKANMIFDLGGNPAGLSLKVSNIIIQKHNPK